MNTARFWHYHQGDVKITLRKGERLCHSHGGPTDEGWTREWNIWEFDGHTVTCEYGSDGADCDGRVSSHGISQCPANKLAAGHSENGVAYPAWRHGERGQRDYSAEAAGY
jgi:hypothetical protein